jgi:hypothetical protein
MARVYAKKGDLNKAEVLANEAADLAPSAENKETANILVGDLLATKRKQGCCARSLSQSG